MQGSLAEQFACINKQHKHHVQTNMTDNSSNTSSWYNITCSHSRSHYRTIYSLSITY